MCNDNNKGVSVIDNPNPRETIENGEIYFKEKICSAMIFDGWTMYEQPVINSMHPDFILSHPEKGIIIVEVKDWHLNPPSYSHNGQVLGDNGKYINKNPISQVRNYREMLMKYEIDEFLAADEKFKGLAQGIVSTVVYFHVASRDRALEFCGKPKYDLIWSKAELDYLCDHTDPKRKDDIYPKFLFYSKSNFAKDTEQTLQKVVGNLNEVLRPSDYARGRSKPILLSSEQANLVKLKKGSIRRWGGVAGSGKSLIIASKASEAIKSGQRVLILTFNITLRHYMRDLCSQQYGLENRRLLKTHLTIAHFHGFLKILLAEFTLSLPTEEFEKIEKIKDYEGIIMNLIKEEVNRKLPNHLRYDSILIDEGQDFNGDWIRFLKQFYTNEGEFFVFYDQAQDLYKNSVWITDSTEVKGIGFSGQSGHLKISHRLPQNIIYQIEKTREVLNMEKQESILPANTQSDLFTHIEWLNINKNADRSALVEKRIGEILEDKVSTIEDITILTMKEETGIELVGYFERKHKFKTSHVYDLTGKGDYETRRNEKWRFQPGKGRLKVCSYHSFKGWESSHIVLLLEGIGDEAKMKEEMEKALFIAMTRVNTFSESRSFLCINNTEAFNWLKPHFNEE